MEIRGSVVQDAGGTFADSCVRFTFSQVCSRGIPPGTSTTLLSQPYDSVGVDESETVSAFESESFQVSLNGTKGTV